MTKFDNGITPAQNEMLAILAEEMGEALQMIGKTLRHGLKSKDPTNEHSLDNRDLLSCECGDVLYQIHMLFEYGVIDQSLCMAQMEQRSKTVGKYLHHCLPVYPSETAHIKMVVEHNFKVKGTNNETKIL
jgi:NTP pyrophosphatase (non-canonical NTP hydrolase)